ncbi:MAG: MerR family transcriptional regulator [Hyphomicrobiales bacterium]|nr:MAG: MerR family transcriptional regulator [Hyphomicrobiales bacterium]
MPKAADAFRTISEVADDLNLPQHVLRFWESRFSQIRPMKRGGGRRYYRPDDVALLFGIRTLLHEQGYTIKGVQKILKDQGIKFVLSLSISSSEDTSNVRSPDTIVNAVLDTAPAIIQAQGNSDSDSISAATRKTFPEETALLVREAQIRIQTDKNNRKPRESKTVSDAANYSAQAGGGMLPKLGKEDIRLLQSTLFELAECKKILDETI